MFFLTLEMQRDCKKPGPSFKNLFVQFYPKKLLVKNIRKTITDVVVSNLSPNGLAQLGIRTSEGK